MKSRISAILRSFALVSILLAAVVPAFAETAQVKETILPNGLRILTKEVHAAPVLSFMVWYKVGSRNEEFGKTGLSHLLEHMQFKGTKTLKKGAIDSLIRKNGGIMNAGTWKDFTFYWETLSSDKLALAMRIESDRMVNSTLDPKEFLSERTVVRSELEGHDNNPDYLTYYEVYSSTFKASPYHWPTIGWVHDIEGLTRTDLYNYYKRYYMPNNATVVIVGDIDTQKAIAMAKKYFGGIPRGPEVPKITDLEPVQVGERTAKIRRAGIASRILIGYHIPAIGNNDLYALDVLQQILGGGESSRLYKALVEKQLATNIEAESVTSKDPNLFLVGATARDGITIGDVEAALRGEIDRVSSAPISDEELQKALNQLEASFIYGNDSVTEQAERLGNMETILSWRYLETYLPNVRKVTKADVQRVAQKYFTERNRTVVTFIPDKVAPEAQQPGEHIGGDTSLAAAPKKKSPTASAKTTSVKKPAAQRTNTIQPSIRPTRVVLDNGMVVILQENRSNPTIAVQGSVRAGGLFDPKGKEDLALITARMLLKGSSKRTAEQIAADSDYAGMDIRTDADAESATFGGRALSKNLDLMLDLLSDSLKNPTFPAMELDKLKSINVSQLQTEGDDPYAIAVRAFSESVFPEGSPYHKPALAQEISSLSGLTREDVVDFYRAHYGPQTAILVVVGDVDTNQAIAKIKERFGDWKQAVPPQPVVIPETPLQATAVRKVIAVPEKSQVSIIYGYAGGLRRTDPDFYAANVMNFIVGGDPFGSRLGKVIRDEMGLVYDVHSSFDAGLGAGAWSVELGTNPKNADKAITALNSQAKRVQETGITDDEVKDAIDYIVGSFPVRLERNSSLAMTLNSAEFFGLGMDYVRRYASIYRSVTTEQVNAAVKKYLHPDKYTLVIAGTYPPKAK